MWFVWRVNTHQFDKWHISIGHIMHKGCVLHLSQQKRMWFEHPNGSSLVFAFSLNDWQTGNDLACNQWSKKWLGQQVWSFTHRVSFNCFLFLQSSILNVSCICGISSIAHVCLSMTSVESSQSWGIRRVSLLMNSQFFIIGFPTQSVFALSSASPPWSKMLPDPDMGPSATSASQEKSSKDLDWKAH